jgi:hypothetical protein
MVEDGALVATVTKKRRSNNILPAVQLDINVGGGRLISLTDGVPHDLDEAHRSAARDQLEILYVPILAETQTASETGAISSLDIVPHLSCCILSWFKLFAEESN